ncbi:hypothetical protein [Methanobrevibacter filiformis]|uniref:Uncharacterized protein n=1 Tax=Methanobrevibacter filiformis TaxID=55758 RepID=A0A166DLU0_9EURY|nr:hypothetical protein [Methanobrevibacter filiformis]KZX15734.1 hypothetical protein MBFIL_05980 [Methanobrevibacter filiformis]
MLAYGEEIITNETQFENTHLIESIKDIKNNIYDKLFNEGIKYYETHTIIVKNVHIINTQGFFLKFALRNLSHIVGRSIKNDVHQYEIVNKETITTLRNLRFRDNGIIIELFNKNSYFDLANRNTDDFKRIYWKDIINCEENDSSVTEVNLNLSNGSSVKIQPILNFINTNSENYDYSDIQSIFCEIINENSKGKFEN